MKHPGQDYHRVLNQYFRISYNQRAVATIPVLATLLQRDEDLDLTWSNYTKQKYLGDNNNPFLAKVSMLTKSCPKLNFIENLISNLGDMKARIYSVDREAYEVVDVPTGNPSRNKASRSQGTIYHGRAKKDLTSEILKNMESSRVVKK